jgi:organic radical activating enzyme
MNSKTFCAAPWMHLNTTPTGNLEPCCIWKAAPEDKKYHFTEFDQWINSDMLTTVRKNLHNGVAIPECHNCYVLDQANGSSMRSRYNEVFANYKNYNELDTVDWHANSGDFVALELKLGNLCDLKCVMCTGENSSQILAEYKLHKEKFDNLVAYYKPDITADFSWPLSEEFKEFLNKFKDNLRSVELTGGEPTLIPYVADFLESIEHPEEVVISLVTNANGYNKKMFDVLTKFKLVNIAISLEGIEADNEMIRFNSSWSNIVENIARYQAMPNVRIVINHVLQAFSVKTFTPLIRWCERTKLRLSLTVLDGPWHLRLDSVPPEKIEQFKSELKLIQPAIQFNPTIVGNTLGVLEKHNYNPESAKRRKEHVIFLDILRKTKLSSIID